MRNNARIISILLLTCFVAFTIMHLAVWFANDLRFDQQCGGYLKLAADANSIELAKERLGKAIEYLEMHHITQGNTSIIVNSPTNDIGEWYKNLKNSHDNLINLPTNLSETDKTNTLIKLRETLIDHGKDGDAITAPVRVQHYPDHNFIFFGWFIDAVTFFVVALCLKLYLD